MRGIVLVAIVASACACASSNSVRRSLVTDSVHVGESRSDVIAWHDAHDWCRGRELDDADEFRACHVAMLSEHTPPVAAFVEYRNGVAIAMAVFSPVPCRVTGFCDRANVPDTFDALYAPGGSRLGKLASAGLHRDPPDEVPDMQRRMLDALSLELDMRYGQANWQNAARTAMTWLAPHGEHIGLFLDDTGNWVIETHLFVPP